VTGVLFRREALAFTRSLGRGGFLRLMVVYVGIFGLYLPSTIESPDLALLPFIFFPLYMAGPVGIDSIAGERERGTLETLLSSPLRPGSLLAGKLLFSAAAGTGFLLLSLGVSIIFRNVRGMALPTLHSAVAVLLLCIVSSGFGAALGMHVSLKARSSRSAQQWFAAVIAVFFVGAGALLKLFGDRLFPGLKGLIETVFSRGWESPAVPAAGGAVLVLTCLLVLWLAGRMRVLWKLNLCR
jgi:hypothetical protein